MSTDNSAKKKLDAAVAKRLKKPLSGWEKRMLFLSFTSFLGASNRQGFCEDMAKFVTKGIKPYEALIEIHRVACGRRSMEWQRNLTTSLIQDMQGKGRSFSEALAKWMPSDEGLMLMTGERSDILGETLGRLVTLQGQRREILAVAWEVAPPVAVIFSALLGLVYYMAGVMQEQIIELIGTDVLAKQAFVSGYLAFCNYMKDWWIVNSLVGIAALSAVVYSLDKLLPSKFRGFLDRHVFPWTMYARTKASYMLISGSMALSTGQTFREFISAAIKHATGWEKWHYKRIMKRLKEGKPEIESMQGGMLPNDIEDRLAVYSKLGDFETVMESVANDSLGGLLKRIRVVGTIWQSLAKFALVMFVVATLLAIGMAALEFQTSIQHQGQGAIQ